jgi:tetratricopeptide (TPR) repeat protein
LIVVAAPSSSDFSQLGDQALGAARLDEAIGHYRSALAIDPTIATIWYNLGWALRSARQFEDALHAYGQALVYGIAHPEEVMLNRAAILADHLFQQAAAEAELKEALTRAPQFVPAMLSLGTLHEDRGQADAARLAYRQALALAPGLGRAYARLAMIDLAEGRATAARTAIDAAISCAGSREDLAEILYAKASALDADGAFDAAFETLTEANMLGRSGASIPYDAAAQEWLVTRLIEAFQSPISFALPSTDIEPKPVFIVGMFRSGSTLSEQLLARHPAICCGGELEFIPATAQSKLHPYPESLKTLDAATVGTLRTAYLHEMRRISISGWTTDKRCDNVLHLGLIQMLFPKAPIIHTVRDPLDTLLSILFLHFGDGVSYGFDQRDAAHYFIQYRRLMKHWQTIFPAAIVEVDYDRLVRNPGEEIEPVFDRLGLSAAGVAVEGAKTGASIRTASSWQVRQPLHQKSSGRWRNYTHHLEPAQQMLDNAGLI